MKKFPLALLLLPGLALAGPSFTGTWKTRVDSMQMTGKPDVYGLAQGVYSCDSCAPPFKIKADGTEQHVPDHDYVDMESVRIVDASTVEITDKKAGKLMAKMSLSASADGGTLNVKFTNYYGDKPQSGSFTERRVAAAAPGSHAAAGSWQMQAMSDMGETIVRLEATPNGMKSDWNGQVVDAKFDGKEYLTTNDPGKTMVTLKKVSDTEIEETDRRQGKVFDIVVWKLAPDGKSIHYEDTDPVHGTKMTWIAERQ